jgi:hypothetical protein
VRVGGLRWAIGALAVVALLAQAPAAMAGSRYDPNKAGHPLRIAGYALHTVGWILDKLIYYPAWVIGQQEPIATIVGSERALPNDEVLESASD